MCTFDRPSVRPSVVEHHRCVFRRLQADVAQFTMHWLYLALAYTVFSFAAADGVKQVLVIHDEPLKEGKPQSQIREILTTCGLLGC